ncbi:hypothetical protein KDA_44700 [Dictyobacter alpinus]|uniref:Pyrrolo-quinoline quinone repeat domain-containing protein n=1 Tax=Dictyobacter alpinus TaxID=2014873 RepID=A0A402BCD3_9CHLR|nr:PQQ-binding-like beta-propeller repeat protein [Dictyobacter alpinus]GCE28986.1 hypothetical protein KDA_44700 [Dictyobacter alpinus]
MNEIIEPAEEQFYPRITLRRAVTKAGEHSIYFASGVHLYALNAGDGALQWCLHISKRLVYKVGDLPPGSLISVPPSLDGVRGLAVRDTRVFVSTESGMAYAFSADTGALIWRRELFSFGGVPLVVGDALYVPGQTNIDALDTRDGSKRWKYATMNVVASPIVIENSTLYAGSYGNAVYALDTATGQPRWTYQTNGRVYNAPIVHNGVVYAGIGDDGCCLTAIDAQSGQLIWRNTPILDSGAQLLVINNLLYTSQRDKLVGIDIKNGRPLWHYPNMRGVSLLFSEHTLYVAATSGDLSAFEIPSHKLLWQRKLRALKSGGATHMQLLGDELYVGFNEYGRGHVGTLHAIDIQTGHEDWVAELDWFVESPAVS